MVCANRVVTSFADILLAFCAETFLKEERETNQNNVFVTLLRRRSHGLSRNLFAVLRDEP